MNESKAARYQRGRRRAQVAGVVSSLVLLAGLAWSSVGARLAAWAAGLGQGWPAPEGAAIGLMAYTAAVALVWQAVWLLSVWSFSPRAEVGARGRREGHPDVSTGAGQGLFGVTALALAGGTAVQVAASLAGPWWWVVAGALAAAALVAAMHLGPGLIAGLSGARPIERPALVERLGALARQLRVPIASVDQLPASASVTATALVAGAGTARRVFIADELMRDWSDDEIAVVVAHEFAHHANHDLWRTLALDVGVLSAGLWAAGAVLRATGVAGDGVPAGLGALPVVALVAGAVWLASAPIRHGLSRRQERAADAFALRLTGRTDAFQTAIRRLAARHLAEERPSRMTRWLFHRHPSAAERLRLAESYERRG